MRTSQRRHLGALGTALKRSRALLFKSEDGKDGAPYEKEFSPRDYVSYLLDVDAEIEHGLMVQYLYAAYSLGGPQVPAQHRDTVRGWQEIILGIAKEEMGHLISVQNVLRLIGAPLNLNREDYPWDVPFYPFPFTLEALTLDSLAKYVYAESPENWTGPIADEVRARVASATPSPHRVSELFELLIPLVQNPDYLPDEVFQADTYPYQASWDEWGRGYQGGKRGNSSRAAMPATPDVLVVALASRDDAVSALQQIAEQGEGTSTDDPSNPSHFQRFLRIYTEMTALAGEGWAPSRSVATNPYVSLDPDMDPSENLRIAGTASPITHPEARLWAQLQNVRYRMLLTYLSHTFLLYGGLTAAGTFTPRGALINGTFGEMYNLRALSEILMQLPLSAGGLNPGITAGPPFQMPYTMNSPIGEANRWRVHLDLLSAASDLIDELRKIVPDLRRPYLAAMQEADQQMVDTATRIISSQINLALT